MMVRLKRRRSSCLPDVECPSIGAHVTINLKAGTLVKLLGPYEEISSLTTAMAILYRGRRYWIWMDEYVELSPLEQLAFCEEDDDAVQAR